MQHLQLNRRQFNAGLATSTASLALGASLASADGGGKPTLLAGAAETVVTPPAKGTFLIGPMKPSTGVNDDLYAGALVLSDGTTRIAIVTIDFLGFDFAYNNVIVRAVTAATGIPAHHVLVNPSHNHSAPLTIPWGKWEKKKDKPWHKTLPGQLAKIVKHASDEMRPASLRYNREPTQIAFNRRLMTHDGDVTMAPNPKGPVAPWIDVLSVEGTDGRRVGVVFSYAAHPVIVHGASTLISGDYSGMTVQKLREMAHGNGVFMFAQGCGGDINGCPLQGGTQAADAAARDLSLAVARAVKEKGHPLEDRMIKDVSSELQLPLQAPPSVARCTEALRGDPDSEAWKTLLSAAESGQQQHMPFPIRAIRLGDQLCILALPHEMFVEYQLFVDKVSPFEHNMVLGYTNGCECYVATEKDYQLGHRAGYEASPTGAAMLYHRRLALQPSVEGQIKEGIERSLRELKSA